MCKHVSVSLGVTKSDFTAARISVAEGKKDNAMNPQNGPPRSAEIESIPLVPQPTVVSDELGRLMAILRGFCRPEAVITFEYNDRLRVHIDVREVEEVARLEAILPSLSGGIFGDLQRGLAAHHSFFHRISATVAR